MPEIDWNYCQINSEAILDSGLKLLLSNKQNDFDDCTACFSGNYVISDKQRKWTYIGEAQCLSKRIKQHSKEKTSSFYKNYIKLNDSIECLSINEFQINTIETQIGRKELEEFGIVNIPTNLNKFQKGKKNMYIGLMENDIWTKIQEEKDNLIRQGENKLMNVKVFDWFSADVENLAGLYWVEHRTIGLIYIGESSSLAERYKTHSSMTYFSALRRHIGENILGFHLHTNKGKKRYFDTDKDEKISTYLKDCIIRTMPIQFGRFELEEYLIQKYNPLLNRKGNKK